MKPSYRLLSLLLATATATTFATTAAHATPAGDNVVINEVYGGGGNSGATYTNDFVELYNPTDAAISLDGMTVEYYAAKGTLGGSVTLSGTIAAKGYYLIQLAAGAGASAALPTPDAIGNLNLSGTAGQVDLKNANGLVDRVGYGNATQFEGAPTKSTSNSTSAARTVAGVDTDNNAADFSVGTPTPQNSSNSSTPTDPVDPADPVTPPAPGEITPIAKIQGTGATAALVGQKVTTRGYVTSSYPEGGFNGFTIQTGGTGKVAKRAGDASDGIFVWVQTGTQLPSIGACVTVAGEVAEYGNPGTSLSQIKNPTITPTGEADCGEAVQAAVIENMPADPAVREAYESMLVQPTGAHTVTNNYELNTYGSVDLAAGDKPYYQATDIYPPSTDPNSDVQRLMKQQAAEIITLDDGRSGNYSTKDQGIALPYISQDGGITIKSLRTGDGVTFSKPVILDNRYNKWSYQPTTPITGKNTAADLPISWNDSRPAVLGVPASVSGEFSLASFNVLNYFKTLGQDVPGATAYYDMNGNPLTVKSGDVRGAYSSSAFNDQQAKIVAAINKLDVTVLGLEEIENTATVTGDASKRDEALLTLVTALNAQGGNWEAVRSPAKVPSGEDAIRVAFIYKKDKVKPVGESLIIDTPAFAGLARQPLAQEFQPLDETKQSFVSVVNHFKSKGSVAKNDKDNGDGQGNNANIRTAQAQSLVSELGKVSAWQEKPVFLLGDLNSYSKETPVTTIEAAGYTNLVEGRPDASPSYQFDGRLGSLDHVLANDKAKSLVRDAKVWDINSDESVAFEYSRRRTNTVDFYSPDVFRASDHDPIKVGFDLAPSTSTPTSTPSSTPTSTPTSTSAEPTSTEPTPTTEMSTSTVTTTVTEVVEPVTTTVTEAPVTTTVSLEPVTTTVTEPPVTTTVSGKPVTVTAEPVTSVVTSTVSGTPITSTVTETSIVSAEPVTSTVTTTVNGTETVVVPTTVTSVVTTTVNGTPVTTTVTDRATVTATTTSAVPTTVTETVRITPAPVTTTVTTTGTATQTNQVTTTVLVPKPVEPKDPNKPAEPSEGTSIFGRGIFSFLNVLLGAGTLFGLGSYLVRVFAPDSYYTFTNRIFSFFGFGRR